MTNRYTIWFLKQLTGQLDSGNKIKVQVQSKKKKSYSMNPTHISKRSHLLYWARQAHQTYKCTKVVSMYKVMMPQSFVGGLPMFYRNLCFHLYSSDLKTKATVTYEVVVITYKISKCYNPEKHNLKRRLVISGLGCILWICETYVILNLPWSLRDDIKILEETLPTYMEHTIKKLYTCIHIHTTSSFIWYSANTHLVKEW